MSNKLNVDAIYCINLDFSTDRWQRMSQRLKNVTPKVRRWDAISPADSRVFDQKKMGNPLSLGAIGCAYSHLDLWKKLADVQNDKEGKNDKEESKITKNGKME